MRARAVRAERAANQGQAELPAKVEPLAARPGELREMVALQAPRPEEPRVKLDPLAPRPEELRAPPERRVLPPVELLGLQAARARPLGAPLARARVAAQGLPPDQAALLRRAAARVRVDWMPDSIQESSRRSPTPRTAADAGAELPMIPARLTGSGSCRCWPR